MNKAFKLLSILMILSMLLASGCSESEEEFECQDEIGCVDIAPDDPIRIAYMFVISGPDESLGTDTARGVEMAVEDKGEVLGHSVEIVPEDSQCNAEGGQAAAQKIAADPTIVAVIGTNCSSAARASVEIISGAGLVMLSPSNTAPDLTDPAKRKPGYGRTCHNDLVQGAAAAEFAWNYLGAKTAATVHDGSLYADQLQQVFSEEFEKLGGTIVAQEAVQPTDTDMRPMLTRIAASSPDFIYYPIFIAAGGFITAQAQEVAGLEETDLMGADGMFSPDFLEAAGEAALGMYHSSPDFGAFGDAYQDFLAEHQEKYGEAPLAPFHAHAYDGATIIMNAIEEVAIEDDDGTLHIGRQALRDAVFTTENYQGLTGNLTCDQYGDCADPAIAVYETLNADPATWDPGSDADSNPKKVWP